MSRKNDGGPAFPAITGRDGPHAYPHGDSGLSIRDYLAAKALAALIGHPGKDGENCGKKAVPTLAKFAYEYADAMLEAREAS